MKLTSKRLILTNIVLLTILSLWIISSFGQMIYSISQQGIDVPVNVYLIVIFFLAIDVFLFILLVRRMIKNN